MAKLKKAFGRQISKWKEEAAAANPGASDEDLAKVINDMARKQGFDYTITPTRSSPRPSRRPGSGPPQNLPRPQPLPRPAATAGRHRPQAVLKGSCWPTCVPSSGWWARTRPGRCSMTWWTASEPDADAECRSLWRVTSLRGAGRANRDRAPAAAQRPRPQR